MYEDLEKFYKKKSPYNIIKRRTFFIYFIFVVISLIFYFFNKVVPMLLVFVVMLIIIKNEIAKELKVKLNFKIVKKNDNDIPLPLIIKRKENQLFKDYLIDNNLYDEKTLLCIIEHYRNMIKTKVVGGNLLAILSIVLPIILTFVKDGFDFNGLVSALPYIIIFSIVIIILYFLYNQIIEIKKLIKGEDGMAERLEEILSEIYVEYINTNNVNKKKILKKHIKINSLLKKLFVSKANI